MLPLNLRPAVPRFGGKVTRGPSRNRASLQATSGMSDREKRSSAIVD